MQEYIKVAFESRGLNLNIINIPKCEVCKKNRSVDVDHIFGRKKKLLLDPYNLMFVCRDCHTNKGNWLEKKRREEIVAEKIKKFYR